MVRIFPVLLQCRRGAALFEESFPVLNARFGAAFAARTADGAGNSFGETKSWADAFKPAPTKISVNSAAQTRCVIEAPLQYVSLGKKREIYWLAEALSRISRIIRSDSVHRQC